MSEEPEVIEVLTNCSTARLLTAPLPPKLSHLHISGCIIDYEQLCLIMPQTVCHTNIPKLKVRRPTLALEESRSSNIVANNSFRNNESPMLSEWSHEQAFVAIYFMLGPMLPHIRFQRQKLIFVEKHSR